MGTQAANVLDDLGRGGPASNGDLASRLPVIVYGDGEHPVDELLWKRASKGLTLRRAQSPERLLDLAAYYLHRNVEKLPEARRDPRRAKPWLEKAIELGVQKKGLDPELGDALSYYVYLSRVDSTVVTKEQAIAVLEKALRFELREETRTAIRTELERLKQD